MNKLLLCFLLALIGLVQPTMYAAVNYNTEPISREKTIGSKLARTEKAKSAQKNKGLKATKVIVFKTIFFASVFTTIASVALLVLGLVLSSINGFWAIGILFANILLFLFIGLIIVLAAQFSTVKQNRTA